jgi:hypothetical protein
MLRYRLLAEFTAQDLEDFLRQVAAHFASPAEQKAIRTRMMDAVLGVPVVQQMTAQCMVEITPLGEVEAMDEEFMDQEVAKRAQSQSAVHAQIEGLW